MSGCSGAAALMAAKLPSKTQQRNPQANGIHCTQSKHYRLFCCAAQLTMSGCSGAAALMAAALPSKKRSGAR
jgi:hypothetical protein